MNHLTLHVAGDSSGENATERLYDNIILLNI